MPYTGDYKWIQFKVWQAVEIVEPIEPLNERELITTDPTISPDQKTFDQNAFNKSLAAEPEYVVTLYPNVTNCIVNTAKIINVTKYYNKETKRFEAEYLYIDTGGVTLLPVYHAQGFQNFVSTYLPPDTTP